MKGKLSNFSLFPLPKHIFPLFLHESAETLPLKTRLWDPECCSWLHKWPFLPACKRGQALYQRLTFLRAAVHMLKLTYHTTRHFVACFLSDKGDSSLMSFSCIGMQAGRIQRAQEGDDLAWNGFTWSTSAVLCLGEVSVALLPPSLSNPHHPPSLSLIIVTQPTLSSCALAYSAVRSNQ